MKITRNNPFSKFKFLALLLAAGLVLWGCDQGLTETEEMQQSMPESSAMTEGVVSAATANRQPGLSEKAKTTNKQLRAISRAVAKMLAEEELRQYVYHRAMEKFDGETNVLWMQLNDRNGHDLPQAMQQANGTPWTTLVKDNLAPGKAQSLAPKLGDVIGRAGQLLGGPVHLYWAFAENFNTDSRAPLVTFTPLGVDADKITNVVAYDASGDTHIVNEAIVKKRPVVVLAGNERVGHDGSMENGVSKDGCGGQIGTPGIDPLSGGGDGCGGGGGGGGEEDDVTEDLPPREDGVTENMFFAQATYCPEGWPNGDCEHKFKILDAQNERIDDAGYQSTYYTNEALDAPGNWVLIDKDIFVWETSDEGNHVVIEWFEIDNQIGDGGPDPMGTQSVNFDDASDKIYCESCGIKWTHRWE